jgi:hypothetical protein
MFHAAVRVLLLTKLSSLPARVRKACHVQWVRMRRMQTGAGGQCVRAGTVLTELASLPARNKSVAERSAARVPVYLAHSSSAPMGVQNHEQGGRTLWTDQTVQIGYRVGAGEIGVQDVGEVCCCQSVLAHIRRPVRPKSALENSPGAEGHHCEQC